MRELDGRQMHSRVKGRACRIPTCANPATPGRSACALHTPPSHDASHGWQRPQAATPTRRIRGWKLQHLRLELFAREPFCRTCALRGRQRLATIRDHIVPLVEGGSEDDSNIAPICDDCSEAKSQREAQRGRARHR